MNTDSKAVDTIEGNRIIAEFMGYKYVEENVWYDVSDEIWKNYKPVNIYSKTPIDVTIVEGEKWLSNLPNPDFGNNDNPKFRSDLEKLNWCTLNRDYFIELQYHSSWDWLMPCFKKFNDMVSNGIIEHDEVSSMWHDILEIAILKTNIADAHNCFVQLIQWYNNSNK